MRLSSPPTTCSSTFTGSDDLGQEKLDPLLNVKQGFLKYWVSAREGVESDDVLMIHNVMQHNLL